MAEAWLATELAEDVMELATLLSELTALLTELSTELRRVPPVAAVRTLDSELVMEEYDEPREDVTPEMELERLELTEATMVLLAAADEPADGPATEEEELGAVRVVADPAVPWPPA